MRRSLPLVSPQPPVENVSPRSVRLSLTDRCDFACVYCRPSRNDGYAERKLDLSSWKTLLLAFRESGIRRVRFTGGEPLLHPDVVRVVELVVGLGFDDVSLTTNASQLERLALPLKRAGLHRLNVSVDTLDPARFREVTRGGELGPVLAGLAAAEAAGFDAIKINTVVLRHFNGDELESLVRWAWGHRFVPRFLEVMPIAEGAPLARTQLVQASEMRSRLSSLLADGPLEPEPDRGPAKYIQAKHDSSLRVGFITGTSDTFCEGCDRLRVSAAGMLRPCLATDAGLDISETLQSGDVDGAKSALGEAWELKPDGKTWKGCTEEGAALISMRAIGG